eukprot:gene14530-4290_t
MSDTPMGYCTMCEKVTPKLRQCVTPIDVVSPVWSRPMSEDVKKTGMEPVTRLCKKHLLPFLQPPNSFRPMASGGWCHAAGFSCRGRDVREMRPEHSPARGKLDIHPWVTLPLICGKHRLAAARFLDVDPKRKRDEKDNTNPDTPAQKASKPSTPKTQQPSPAPSSPTSPTSQRAHRAADQSSRQLRGFIGTMAQILNASGGVTKANVFAQQVAYMSIAPTLEMDGGRKMEDFLLAKHKSIDSIKAAIVHRTAFEKATEHSLLHGTPFNVESVLSDNRGRPRIMTEERMARFVNFVKEHEHVRPSSKRDSVM